MGNHQAGQAMGRAAEQWWATHPEKPSQEKALEVLDMICLPHQTCDAEWEAMDPKNPNKTHPDYEYHDQPNAPLGRLIAIAFDATPEEIAAYDSDDFAVIDLWYDGPCDRFRKRYNFY